tara:strand:+ start:186 stop:971 length:786 start_codon:yes stop_codon:yes gene_type:complete
MLKFSANISLLYTDLPVLDRIKAAADDGFTAFEIHFPYEVPIDDLSKAINLAKIKLALFNFPAGDFSDGGPGIACLAERESHFRAAVAEAKIYAEALNPYCINILAGIPPKHIDKEVSKKIFINNLEYASNRFINIKSKILIEPINIYDRPNFLINRTKEAVQIIKDLGCANLKVLFDIYHMQRMGEDIFNSLTKYIDFIGHIQFADFPGRNEPGTGIIGFDEIFKILNKINYSHYLGAEYNPFNSTHESLSWLNKLKLND